MRGAARQLLLPVLWALALLGALPGLAASPLVECRTLLRSAASPGAERNVCFRDWLTAVSRRTGCPVDIELTPRTLTERRLQQIREGRYDLIMGASDIPERRDYAWFSRPYAVDNIRLLLRKDAVDRWPIRSLCDARMQAARVAGPSQGWYGPEWEAVRQGHACGKLSLYTTSPAEAVELLMHDRVDLLLAAERTWRFALSQQREQLTLLPLLIHAETMHLMFSKKTVSAAQVAAFNVAILAEQAENGPPCGFAAPELGETP